MSTVEGQQAEAAGSPTAREGNSRRRKLGIGALIALGSLMLCVAVFATWLDRVFLDTQTWTDTSTEALQQPAVRNAVAQQLTDQLYANVNVAQALSQALPPRLKPFAGTIAGAGEPYIERAVAAGLERPRVVQLWATANRNAHGQLMHILNGGGSTFSTANGTVTLDLTPILGNVSETLSARTNGAVALPSDAGKITLLKSDQLRQTQDGVKILRLLSIPLALAALAVLAIAVAISRERRRTLRAIAWGVLAAGLVLILIRRVVGDEIVNSLTTVPNVREAGHAIWWVATERLAAANITVVTVGLVLLVGTWFAGPGRHATSARRVVTPYLREPAVAYGGYAALVLLLLVWAPVPAARYWVTALILTVLGAIGVEAMRRLSVAEFPDRTERDLGGRVGDWASGAWRSVTAGDKPAAAAPAQAAAAPAAPDRYVTLERLASLHERGILSDEEFAAEKAATLANR
jgi:Short C-terminal domain